MAAGYVEVPAEVLRGMLLSAGFKRQELESRREEVFVRAHDKDPRFEVRVYTSLSAGASSARGKGKDAIRVVATFDAPSGKKLGIWKGKRVHRAGSVEAVLERTLGRMREAYAHLNKVVRGGAR